MTKKTNIKETIKSIEKEYLEIAKRICAPAEYVRFTCIPRHDGGAHIEYEGNELLYINTERGEKIQVRRTLAPEELLFWLIDDLTYMMACDYSENFPDRDTRKIMFLRHVELLLSINHLWAKDKKAKYEKIMLFDNDIKPPIINDTFYM
jgi:hypothetical protein